MPRFTHADALDNGPVYVKNNVKAVWLVPGYTTAMAYASADSAKVCAVTMTSTDRVRDKPRRSGRGCGCG